MTNTLHLKDVVRNSQQKYSVEVSLRKMDELEEDYFYHLAEHYQAECKFHLAKAACAVADAEVRQAKANLRMLKARQVMNDACGSLGMAENKLDDYRFDAFIRDSNEKRLALDAA